MIWFGNLQRVLPAPTRGWEPVTRRDGMLRALEEVAERAPHLHGTALLDALAATGWVDRDTAARLLPEFDYFDADRHFAEYLRRLSFRGRGAASEFRLGVRFIAEELTGSGTLGDLGPEPAIRFAGGDREGVILAHPEVCFTIGGATRDAIVAAVDEMPDVLVVVARNFDSHAAAQLDSILDRTGVPGTLITLNLLLGIRAITLRYQPSLERIIQLLGTGRPLRSADIACLGERG